jgi:uncharacterized protein YbjT (DUF2867 family)
MRIVVAGGTGFVGRQVVAELLQRGGHELVVTSRRPEAHDAWRGRVRVVQAFAGDDVSMGKAFQGADVVVQCIQFQNHPVQDRARGRTYMEVDARGTAVAARVAKRLHVRRFVYLSGAGAGRGLPQEWMRAKDLAEQAVRDAGLEAAFLRPSWVYGPGDRTMSRFVWFCRHLPVVPVIGDGSTPVFPSHVSDVARAVADLVLREDAAGQALEFGAERLTMDEVVRTVQRVIGRRRPLLHHPVPLMKLLTLPLQALPEPILSPEAVAFITQAVEIDPAPARAYFGFPLRTLEEGLPTVV